MKKFIPITTLVVLSFFIGVFADARTNDSYVNSVNVASSNDALGASTNMTITANFNSAIPSGSKITIEFHGVGLSETNHSISSATVSGLSGTLASLADNEIVVTTDAEIPAGNKVFNINGVTNPAVSTTYRVWIGTDASDESGVPNFDLAEVYATASSWATLDNTNLLVQGNITANGDVTAGWVEIYNPDKTYYAGGAVSEGQYWIFKAAADVWPSGDYTIKAYPGTDDGEYLTYTGTVNYTSGITSNYNIALSAPNKTISGTVQDAQGNPVEATVNITGTNGITNSYPTTSAANGFFSEDVNPDNAPYVVTIDNCTGEASSTECGAFSYLGATPEIDFALGAAVAETIDIFTLVTPTTATVTGTVSYSGATTEGLLDFYSGTETHRGVMEADGSFTVALPPGRYNIDLLPMQDEADPNVVRWQIDPDTFFDISAGANDLGTIEAMYETSSIVATVTDTEGNPLEGTRVLFWRASGGEFREVNVMSGSNGRAGSEGSAGTYHITVDDPQGKYIPVVPSIEYDLQDNEEAEVTFVMEAADVTIDVELKYADGTKVAGLSSYVQCYDQADQKDSGVAADYGEASVRVAAGNYVCDAALPEEAGYSVAPVEVGAVAEGATEVVEMTLIPHDATLSGTLVNQDGEAIGNTASSSEAIFGEVADEELNKVIITGDNNLSFEVVPDTNGAWSTTVPAGDYEVMAVGPEVVTVIGQDTTEEIAVTAGETVADQEIDVYQADDTITATILEADGTTPQAYAYLECNYLPAGEIADADGERVFQSGAFADADGKVSVPVLSADGAEALTYDCAPSISEVDAEIAPAAEQDLAPGGDTTFTFAEADATITVDVPAVEGVTMDETHCVAWFDEGVEKIGATDDDGDGEVVLSVSSVVSDEWNVACEAEDGTNSYVAEAVQEVAVSPNATATATVEVEENVFDLFEPVSETFSANTPKELVVGDMEISIPANAIAATGDVTVTVTPEATEILKDESNMNFGIPVSIEAFNEDGKFVNDLSRNVDITINYSDDNLEAVGIDEEDLTMKYHDGVAGSWISDGFNLDTENNEITVTVDHFTQFNTLYNAKVAGSQPIKVKNVRVPKKTRKTKTATVKWKEHNQADTYKMYLATKKGKKVKVFKNITKKKKKIKAKWLATNKAYKVKVRAVTSSGRLGKWSNFKKFRTLPAKVKKLKAPKAKITSTSAKFTWKKVRGKGFNYKIKLMNKKGKKIKVFSSKKRTKMIKELKPGKTYKVRVRAKYNKNNLGAWSKVKKIKTLAL